MNAINKIIRYLLVTVLVFSAASSLFAGMLQTENSEIYIVEEDDASSAYDNNTFTKKPEENPAYSDESYQPSSRKEAYDLRENKISNTPVGVRSDAKQYDFTGLCSWYGREFHGRLTASGTKFDMYGYTAAHKTLPFGTVLLVTNLSNNKTVRVTVTDRGPYKEPRILDLSYAAGRDIDMLAAGEVKIGVKIVEMGDGKRTGSSAPVVAPVSARYSEHRVDEYVNEEPPVKQVLKPSGIFQIQVGAFYTRRNAEKLKIQLESMFPNDVEIVTEEGMYKVRIKNITDLYEADEMKKRLGSENLSGFVIK
ncbi:MAG: septal ring lytic transglycosylase RlpA family protein [Spirochaetes bacterium]|nr:septal ring lytic transglycosylase RlpA family protein [Spirochaetota bacterium]